VLPGRILPTFQCHRHDAGESKHRWKAGRFRLDYMVQYSRGQPYSTDMNPAEAVRNMCNGS
jgi:hypothetical protein